MLKEKEITARKVLIQEGSHYLGKFSFRTEEEITFLDKQKLKEFITT